MHSTATWLELAAMTRAMADELTELADRRSMLDIVTDHEWWANWNVTGIEPVRWFGAYHSQRGW